MTFGRPTRLGHFKLFNFIFFFKAKCHRVIWTARQMNFSLYTFFAFTRVYHIFLSSGFKKKKMKNFWTILGPQRIFFRVKSFDDEITPKERKNSAWDWWLYKALAENFISPARLPFLPFFLFFGVLVLIRAGENFWEVEVSRRFCFLLPGWFTTLKIIIIKKLLWWCLWNDVDKDGRVNNN